MSTVTVKGQVTIPKPIREILDIHPGSAVDFIMGSAGEVVLRKAGAAAGAGERAILRFDRAVGSAGPGMTTDEIMALLRGEN
ncbi:AbrB/MazE/SpoVT family DNA-binding domain-containing protein [Rhodopila sp.]|uniref:AbrB/MazE/SpoVT family DNA-binding domain-containing protein n=1 Tax=Rhodopila sp. TaxID=2480087 RepID=UPI003D14382F